MDNKFGSDFITISGDDGSEYELEHLDTIEIDGVFYLSFLPADVDEDSSKYGLLILKQEEENGESFLVVPDDDELNLAYQQFMERLYSEDEDNDDEDKD